MEKRLHILETTCESYGRRITDHDGKFEAILAWKASIEESTEVNRKMVEVGENLLVALHWVGIAAKWITTIGAAFGVFYVAFRWIGKKAGI